MKCVKGFNKVLIFWSRYGHRREKEREKTHKDTHTCWLKEWRSFSCSGLAGASNARVCEIERWTESYYQVVSPTADAAVSGGIQSICHFQPVSH